MELTKFDKMEEANNELIEELFKKINTFNVVLRDQTGVIVKTVDVLKIIGNINDTSRLYIGLNDTVYNVNKNGIATQNAIPKYSPKFKVDEWCFCDFKLSQVKETNRNKITEVNTGYFILSGLDLSDNCYPLTPRIKIISEEFEHWRDKISNAVNNRALNIPHINRKLIDMWITTCKNIEDDAFLEKQMNEVKSFCIEILDKLTEINKSEVEGIKIFK